MATVLCPPMATPKFASAARSETAPLRCVPLACRRRWYSCAVRSTDVRCQFFFVLQDVSCVLTYGFVDGQVRHMLLDSS